MNAFAHLKFPDYKFHEYPKWVKRRDGTSIIVGSQREEISLIATEGTSPADNPADREKEALLGKIKELELALAQSQAPALKAAADNMIAQALAQPSAQPSAQTLAQAPGPSTPTQPATPTPQPKPGPKPEPDPKALQQSSVISDLVKP